MKRKNQDKISVICDALLCILAVSGLFTLTGLLSQGRNADKLFRAVVGCAAWRIKKALRLLQIKGLIEYTPEDEHAPIYITKKGFFRYTRRKFKQTKYEKWDHLWRLIIFDISECSNVRRKFQHCLKSIGCFKIQKSIYAYPFDCKNDIKSLASNFSVSTHVEVLTIPNLGSHERPARQFYFQRANE